MPTDKATLESTRDGDKVLAARAAEKLKSCTDYDTAFDLLVEVNGGKTRCEERGDTVIATELRNLEWQIQQKMRELKAEPG